MAVYSMARHLSLGYVFKLLLLLSGFVGLVFYYGYVCLYTALLSMPVALATLVDGHAFGAFGRPPFVKYFVRLARKTK